MPSFFRLRIGSNCTFVSRSVLGNAFVLPVHAVLHWFLLCHSDWMLVWMFLEILTFSPSSGFLGLGMALWLCAFRVFAHSIWDDFALKEPSGAVISFISPHFFPFLPRLCFSGLVWPCCCVRFVHLRMAYETILYLGCPMAHCSFLSHHFSAFLYFLLFLFVSRVWYDLAAVWHSCNCA